MSIKYKIPLTMFIALSINILLLIGYYRFSLSGRVAQYQENMQNIVTSATENIASSIEGMDLTTACLYIESFSNPNNLTFTLTAVNGDDTCIFGDYNKGSLGFFHSETVNLSNGIYILQTQKFIYLFNFKTHDVFRDLLFFEIIMITVVFVLLGGIIHFRYVRSLLRLNTTISSYKSGTMLNISPRGKDEIGRLEQSFLTLSQKLHDEKQTQNRIIASISHDIKTPLTSVLGYSERLLKKELPSTRQTEYLNRIHTCARDIAAIVDEFDDYLGAVIPEAARVQSYTVSYICQMLIDEYETKIREKGGHLSVENRCGNNDLIRVDLLGLRRVLANIIGNSIRHSGAEKLEVWFTAEKCSEYIVFRLSDNGKGVSETELNHLFEPFYTSDRSRKLSGLGLSICKQIVESMGGLICAVSNGTSGISIVISIPTNS